MSGPSRHTYADYVATEQTSSTKHEFFDGEIYAMAGIRGGSVELPSLAALLRIDEVFRASAIR